MDESTAPQIIVLSAKNKERLQAYAQKILAFLENGPDVSLTEMAYTLQVGREAMEERLAFVISSAEELMDGLSHYQQQENVFDHVYQGNIKVSKEIENLLIDGATGRAIIKAVVDNREYDKLAQLWVSGVEIDWRWLHEHETPNRISLPTYPFARKRYWFDSYHDDADVGSTEAAAKIILPDSIAKERSVWASDAVMQAAQSYQGQAVQVQVIDETIALVKMADSSSKNMFSEELMLGLHKHLFEIQQNKTIKAVILTGYDNIFCMGGTQAALSEIADRRRNFTDVPLLYRGLLELDVPVITAMQGHALGGGLLFGLYGDIILMAKEGIYSANFMKYGFTPGMGATYILGEKLGKNLATEMMYTANMFDGEHLHRRGASVIVCDQKDVLAQALQIARQLAKKPRQALTVLKQVLSGSILAELVEHIAQEVEMHEATFGADAVKAEIAAHFAKIQGSPQKIILAEAGQVAKPASYPSAASQARKIKLAPPVRDHRGNNAHPKSDAPLKHNAQSSVVQTPTLQEPVVQASRPKTEMKSSLPVKAQLKSILQTILHLDAHEIDEQAVFQALGVDSIGSVEIIREVNAIFGLNLEAVALYDHHTIEKLSLFIETELAHVSQTFASIGIDGQVEVAHSNEQNCEEPVATKVQDYAAQDNALYTVKQMTTLPEEVLQLLSKKPLSTDNDAIVTKSAVVTGESNTVKALDIAIIGMSGRFPGADDLEAFWQNLANGVDSISRIPSRKWNLERYYDPDPRALGKSYSQWVGSLDDEDKFDANFFNISPREAERMDVQQRLFLEESWKALEDAAYAPSALRDTKCSIYVGVGQGDYHHNLPQNDALDAHAFMGAATSILTARLAYHMDLKGGSIAIDTACSSSLVAIHKACQSIRSGESELAMAGGVYVGTTSRMHIMASKAMMLAPDGRCKTFDNRADGFVIGEGVGVLVLKKLEQAILDGDSIYGVIKGSGINQDGRTNGITAPSVESQQRLETEIYTQYDIDPNTITLVEAHGTGTKLGDPIEVRALTNAFRAYTDQTGYCAIGSVKTNIGHALTAAGVAGVLKVLLALKYKMLPPSLHFEAPNEHIDFENSPFYVNTQLLYFLVKA